MEPKTFITALATLLLASSAFAGEPDAKNFSSGKSVEGLSLDPQWSSPILGAGMKSNGRFNEGNLFFIYPWHNTIGEGGRMEGSVYFLESYNTWADGGELGSSLGIGFRHLFSSQTVTEAMTAREAGFFDEGIYVGGNVFVDYLNSTRDGDLWQVGFGLEAGTRYLELRSNYYLPFEDETVFGTQTNAAGVFQFYQEAMEGWDVELAFLVPGIDQFCDVQLIGGYYGYSGDRTPTSNIDGLRVGVEVRPIPNLVLSATWFESNLLYQDNWLAGVSIEIPLGGRDLYGSAFKSRRRHLSERLFKKVRRKNSAITLSQELQDQVGPAPVVQPPQEQLPQEQLPQEDLEH